MSNFASTHRRQPTSPFLPHPISQSKSNTSYGLDRNSDCDKELHRVKTISVSSLKRLRDDDQERDIDRKYLDPGMDFYREYGNAEPFCEAFVYHSSDPWPASPDTYPDSGYKPEQERSHRSHSRQRHSNSTWEKQVASTSSCSIHVPSPIVASATLADVVNPRKQSNAMPPTAWLSRSIHIPSSPRSASWSRSPLPPTAIHSSFSEAIPLPSFINRHSSRILLDDSIDPIMTALYDLIGVATDVTDMISAASLTAQPKVCESLVQRVQTIDWHGQNWYMQVLLAIASLSCVQFWNFDDNEDEQDEPLMFVLRPPDEHPPAPTPIGRHSRDDVPKDLSFLSLSSEQPAQKAIMSQAETAQNRNIDLELSLDGDHFIWVNYAWRVVVGTEPSKLAATGLSHLLAPADCPIFQAATHQLQQDDLHTVEARFGLQVELEGDHDASISGILCQQMEGKGMLVRMHNRLTVWVAKPVGPLRWDYPSPSIVPESGGVGNEPIVEEPSKELLADRSGLEPMTPFPFAHPISTEPILCWTCECQIPQWYYEKHSETCVEVHRPEAEIVKCNESIGELKNTIRVFRDIMAAMDTPSATSPPNTPIFTHSSLPSIPSPLQLFWWDYMQMLTMRKTQRRLLESLDEILLVASEIFMPSLKDEESKESLWRQRLLSPGLERKMSQIRTWCQPPVEDAALSQLAEDVERIMMQKVDNVVRMQNTVKYSEKIGHEWEEKVTGSLAIVEAGESSDSEDEGEYHNGIDPSILPIPEDVEAPVDDDHATNQSEELLSSEPTPMASESPMLIATPNASRASVSAPVPQFTPPAWQIINKMPTMPSMPLSISLPPALAAPITASPSPDDQPPYMDLNDSLPGNATVTPPLSPSISSRDAPTATRRGHRRHSTVNLIFSPSVSNVPLSPRQSSAAPLSRSTPTSIKDFDIKPISKGAFKKKKAIGAYYAIKVLKKADMIAKNQITNVKVECMILMTQAESPFVAKLYFTFQSKENLYLVVEYLNGGDCAALIKSLGSLPEEWTKQYIAEVRGVVHRDLKPDNLLIDQHGHLKLTDFGLRRIGLLGRQTREPMGMGMRDRSRYDSRSRPPSIDSGFLSSPLLSTEMIGGDDASESGPESIYSHHSRRSRAGESPLQSFATELTTDLRSYYSGDYLAPETILGLRGDDAVVDWFFNEARDSMQWLMCIDPSALTSTEAVFIPQVSDPESTDYFDPRGAIPQLFHEEDIGTLPALVDSAPSSIFVLHLHIAKKRLTDPSCCSFVFEQCLSPMRNWAMTDAFSGLSSHARDDLEKGLFLHWLERPASSTGQSSSQFDTPRPSVHLIDLKKGADLTDRVVTCLLAEDNPITAKILETLHPVAMSDIKFECTLMDSHMSVVDGEGTARYIKTTNGRNSNTPMVAVSAYSAADTNDSSLFTASLTKSMQRADFLIFN
ncbi:hypothetical protein BDR06DRAFT_1047252 [Suillus hirtellus]|nr:hypothetical protein BDR06DRAFT_1047252 [Suillus hirtellus]